MSDPVRKILSNITIGGLAGIVTAILALAGWFYSAGGRVMANDMSIADHEKRIKAVEVEQNWAHDLLIEIRSDVRHIKENTPAKNPAH